MREALTEVIDLLIIYACKQMHEGSLVGSQNIYTAEIPCRSYVLSDFAALQREGVMKTFLYSHNGKQMLTNSQLQQHEVVTSEMLAAIDGSVSFQASESHTAWLTALGSMEFVSQTKPSTTPDKHKHPRTPTIMHKSLHTHTYSHKHSDKATRDWESA